MADRVKVDVNCSGPIWFIGWLFTIAFAQLGMPQVLYALIIWPWYLGMALR